MKYIIKNSARLAAFVFLVFSVTFCTEELDTNQYSSSQVTLASWGPNPVMRGATLMFYGSNLQQVVSVTVPGVDPVTTIEVISEGEQSEIRIQLPDDGTEEGYIVLTTDTGKTLTTQTEVTYTEPIVFDSFSPTEAMPGDEITFEGDYMNLVTTVTFGNSDEAEVTCVDRYKATAIVPANATTGTVILSDGDNLIYSSGQITIGDPTVSSVSASPATAGGTVTIEGKYLQMIQTVTFTDGVEVDVAEFTLNDDYTGLYLTLPDEAASGDVVCTSYAGNDFTAGSIELLTPGNLVATPQPVKAGKTLAITGDNLDVVSYVYFPNVSDAVDFSYSESEGISVTVPAAATEGDITLALANGTESVTVAYTLVVPTLTSVSPAEIVAGETLTITGTDLDLITGVTLGSKSVDFTIDSETQITATTVPTSVSGAVVLSLANGTTVTSDETVTVTYDSYIIINNMPESAHIGAAVTFEGENFLMIESIYIGTAKVTSYSVRTDNQITFIMPYNSAPAYYDITFCLTTGEEEVYPTQIQVLLEQEIVTIWEGNSYTGDSWDNNLELGDTEYAWVNAGVTVGSTVKIYFTVADESDWQFQVYDGHWNGLNVVGGGNQYNAGNSPTAISDGYIAFTVDEAVYALLTDVPQYWGCAIIVNGQYVYITKVELLTDISQEQTIWEGSQDSGSWDEMDFGDEEDWINAGLQVGDTIYIYFTASDDNDWMFQVYDGHWNSLYIDAIGGQQFNENNSPSARSDGYVSFVVDDDIHSLLTTKAYWGCAMIMNGQYVTITKITMK